MLLPYKLKNVKITHFVVNDLLIPAYPVRGQKNRPCGPVLDDRCKIIPEGEFYLEDSTQVHIFHPGN